MLVAIATNVVLRTLGVRKLDTVNTVVTINAVALRSNQPAIRPRSITTRRRKAAVAVVNCNF